MTHATATHSPMTHVQITLGGWVASWDTRGSQDLGKTNGSRVASGCLWTGVSVTYRTTDSSLCAPGGWGYEHMISTAQSTLTSTLLRSCAHLVRSGPGQTLMRAYAQFLGQESLLPTHLQGLTSGEDRGVCVYRGRKVCEGTRC